jgi:tetratricopeptide (TPR) repeat protein
MSPPFEVAKAHRRFAIELNNRAWDLIDAPARTAAETAEMLSAAHASRYHWRQVGTLVNHLRADTLVAAAYLTAGHPTLALGYAQSCLQLCEQAGDDATAFDRACAYAGLGSALAALQHIAPARAYYQQALQQVAQFEDDDERAVFAKLYPPTGMAE